MNRAIVFLLLALMMTGSYGEAAERPKTVSRKVWNSVKPYLLPDDHPIKPSLDRIFSRSRAILNTRTMRKAGFVNPKVRKWTHIIVTTHPELPGYVIKTYLDAQRYHNHQPEHKRWIVRISGARAIQEMLDENGWNHLFKVPKKWIYALPETPGVAKEYLRKHFILVEEDMHLVGKRKNKDMWRSSSITIEHLDALYQILRRLGLSDCVKPDNLPFSCDGRIAFIDTDSYMKGHVPYRKLTPHLCRPMQKYWLGI